MPCSFFSTIPLYFLSNLWVTNNKSSQPIITIVSKTIEAKPVMLQNFHKEADMKSGAINIDDYIGVQPEEQFEFIYTHYPIMKNLLTDYREDLIDEVIEQKSYNRRAANGDLGVRVQISIGISSPTEKQAINHMTIEKAIVDGVLDEEFFEDTDNQEELIRKVTCYHAVSEDVKTFTKKLGSLEQQDQKILKPYIMGQKSMSDLAEDMGIDYRSAIKHIYRVKKRLSAKVQPKLFVVKRGA